MCVVLRSPTFSNEDGTSSLAIAERPRDARVTSIRKIASGIFEPPFAGALRGNIDASCVRRWKKRGRLPGDN